MSLQFCMQIMFFLILPECIALVAEKRGSRGFALHYVRAACTRTLRMSWSLFASVLCLGIAIIAKYSNLTAKGNHPIKAAKQIDGSCDLEEI